MIPIYNWLLCPRCKHFVYAIGVNAGWFCKAHITEEPMAFTGDGEVYRQIDCKDFMPSGKRGFETRREENATRQKAKGKPAKKDKVQRRKKKHQEQDQEDQKTLKEVLR